jgi:hypothetical protein
MKVAIGALDSATYVVIPANLTTSFVGFAIQITDTASPYQGQLFISLFDGNGNGEQLTVGFERYGIVRLRQGGHAGAILGESRPGAFLYGRDFYFEIGSKIDPTTGWAEVRINTVALPGASVVAAHTQQTANSDWNLIKFFRLGGEAGDCLIDDGYVNDDQGGVNDTYLGNTQIQCSLANGPGDAADFSRSNALLANWQCVLNETIDDSLYVYDPTIGDGDLYAVTPLIDNPTIFDVQITGYYRQTDATQRFVRNQLKASGTLVQGASTAINQTFGFVSDIITLNPGTGLGFTGAQVNGSQIGPYVDA